MSGFCCICGTLPPDDTPQPLANQRPPVFEFINEMPSRSVPAPPSVTVTCITAPPSMLAPVVRSCRTPLELNDITPDGSATILVMAVLLMKYVWYFSVGSRLPSGRFLLANCTEI